MNMNMNRYKAVLLGEAGVGKSSIVHRYVNDNFYELQESTIGAAFFKKTHRIDNENSIILEIWDTAGQERYHGLAPMYYRGAHLILVVFDVTNTNSFARAQKYINELRENLRTNNVVIAFLGNKIDMEKGREVSKLIAEGFAKQNNLLYYEISAKTGYNIEEMFNKLCNHVYLNCNENNINITNRVNILNQNIDLKNDSCC